MSVEAWLSRRLMERHPDDAARTLEAMPAQDAAGAISEVAKELAGRVVARMELSGAAACLAACKEDRAAAILAATPTRIATPNVRRMEPGDRERLLQRLEL